MAFTRLPAATNTGHVYRDRVGGGLTDGTSIAGFYAAHHRHSARSVWLQRLAAGEIVLNGQRLSADQEVQPGDQLEWHRPPWLEPAVPALPLPLFDDGDLTVFDKPSGLPVLPAGGFLEHTVLRQLERCVARGDLDARAGLPRPVHRLGRHTSGLLVCARRRTTRAWLSALLRDSTVASQRQERRPGCTKLYRALTHALPGPLSVGEIRRVTMPIGWSPHPLLGRIWCAGGSGALAAESDFTLLERAAVLPL